jgi:hypothetical protein
MQELPWAIAMSVFYKKQGKRKTCVCHINSSALVTVASKLPEFDLLRERMGL